MFSKIPVTENCPRICNQSQPRNRKIAKPHCETQTARICRPISQCQNPQELPNWNGLVLRRVFFFGLVARSFVYLFWDGWVFVGLPGWILWVFFSGGKDLQLWPNYKNSHCRVGFCQKNHFPIHYQGGFLMFFGRKIRPYKLKRLFCIPLVAGYSEITKYEHKSIKPQIFAQKPHRHRKMWPPAMIVFETGTPKKNLHQ